MSRPIGLVEVPTPNRGRTDRYSILEEHPTRGAYVKYIGYTDSTDGAVYGLAQGGHGWVPQTPFWMKLDPEYTVTRFS